MTASNGLEDKQEKKNEENMWKENKLVKVELPAEFLNVTKTEMVIFKAKCKVFDTDCKFKMSYKNFFSSHHVKYLGIYIDKYLSWITHLNQVCVKHVKANAKLSKIWYFF